MCTTTPLSSPPRTLVSSRTGSPNRHGIPRPRARDSRRPRARDPAAQTRAPVCATPVPHPQSRSRRRVPRGRHRRAFRWRRAQTRRRLDPRAPPARPQRTPRNSGRRPRAIHPAAIPRGRLPIPSWSAVPRTVMAPSGPSVVRASVRSPSATRTSAESRLAIATFSVPRGAQRAGSGRASRTARFRGGGVVSATIVTGTVPTRAARVHSDACASVNTTTGRRGRARCSA